MYTAKLTPVPSADLGVIIDAINRREASELTRVDFTQSTIRTVARDYRTSGYRIIADGKVTSHKTARTALREVGSIRGGCVVFRDYLGSLTLDFDA